HRQILPGVATAPGLCPGCRGLLHGHPGIHALQLVAAAGLELVRGPDTPVPYSLVERTPHTAAVGPGNARRCRDPGVAAGYHAAQPARGDGPRRGPLVAVSEGGIP